MTSPCRGAASLEPSRSDAPLLRDNEGAESREGICGVGEDVDRGRYALTDLCCRWAETARLSERHGSMGSSLWRFSEFRLLNVAWRGNPTPTLLLEFRRVVEC